MQQHLQCFACSRVRAGRFGDRTSSLDLAHRSVLASLASLSPSRPTSAVQEAAGVMRNRVEFTKKQLFQRVNVTIRYIVLFQSVGAREVIFTKSVHDVTFHVVCYR